MTINPLNQENNKQQDLSLADTQAKKIAGLLNTHADYLSMRTLKQLENSREIAVKAHVQQHAGIAINQDGTISYLFSWVDHHRLALTGLLLSIIIAGFILMQMFSRNSEHGDAFLLGADLPPEAFVDRGFEPLLNNTHAKL